MLHVVRSAALIAALGAAAGLSPIYAQGARVAAVSTTAIQRSPASRPDAPTITVHADSTPVWRVLRDIARQAGLTVVYARGNGDSTLDGAMSLHERGASVQAALTDFVQASGVALVLTGRTLVVKRPPAPAAGGTIVGRVTDAGTAEGIGAASVVVEGTRLGAVTNDSGQYRIADVPAGTYTVSARRIGYGKTTDTVAVEADREVTVNFVLKKAATTLDQIVVTGTVGQTRRKEVGNSIAAVSASDLTAQPIQNVQGIIDGRVPGVAIMENSGVAGAGGTIRIRGMNSVTQGNRPLIYVDGVRMYSDAYPLSAQGQSASPLNDIDPSDIARIEVIKGASATTLYGTEASNGVIQIFTKRGLAGGAPHWEAKLTEGVNVMPEVGPPESAAFIKRYGTQAKGLFLDQWLRKGLEQDYSLSVASSTGGSKPVSYFLSAGYNDNQGVLPDQYSKGYNVRSNIGFSPTSKITISFNSAYTRRDIKWLPSGNLSNGFTLNVMRGPFDYTQDQDSVFLTQFHVLENDTHLMTGGNVTLTLTPNWLTKVVVGIDYVDSDYGSTVDFGSLLVPDGSRQERRFRNVGRQLDVQSTYTSHFWNMSSATSAGFQMYDNSRLTVNGNVRNFSGPGEPTLSSGSQQNVSESRLSVINAGAFFQELLGIADRLFLTGGVRIDGNSAFGTSFGKQAYPKFSASYIVSDNNFWPDVLGQTKLRMAYGESGKAPGYFDAQETWAPTSAQGGQPGVTPLNRGNPNLGPERSKEIEAGFESSPFGGRMSIDFSVFHQETVDALLAVPQDPSTGYLTAQIENVGTIKNHGFELALSGTVLHRGGFEWNAGINASATKSVMADMGSSPSIFVGTTTPDLYVKEGFAVPGFWGPKLLNPNEKAAPKVEDGYFGPAYPTHTLSFNTSVKLGARVEIAGLMEFQGGAYNLSNTADRNVQRSVWPPCYDVAMKVAAGQTADLTAQQRYSCSPKEVSYGAYISKTDFWRLRSVGLTYQVPKRFTGGEQWTVMLGGRNLWTSTNYVGLDPEVSDRGDQLRREEYYQVPTPRTFTFSLRASF